MNIKKTKIVCTIGPASESVKTITKMVEAGMDIARSVVIIRFLFWFST